MILIHEIFGSNLSNNSSVKAVGWFKSAQRMSPITKLTKNALLSDSYFFLGIKLCTFWPSGFHSVDLADDESLRSCLEMLLPHISLMPISNFAVLILLPLIYTLPYFRLCKGLMVAFTHAVYYVTVQKEPFYYLHDAIIFIHRSSKACTITVSFHASITP